MDDEVIRDTIRKSVWQCASVSEEPTTDLTSWSVRRIPTGACHLVGWTGSEGRVSSPIVTWDSSNRTATTRSGRRYHLSAAAGRDADADWVWGRWVQLHGVTSWTDVSSAFSDPGAAGDDESRLSE